VENNLSQKRAGGVSQGLGPEFKPQYRKRKKKEFGVLVSEQGQAGGVRVKVVTERSQ
jgi:hypothetical protein